MKIGTEYNKQNYNCAHYVADWYKEKLKIEIPVDDVFDRRFVVWMRSNFEQVAQPSDHSLVLMVNHDDTYHIGVYYNFRIYHNFKPAIGNGSVCNWTMGAVQAYFKQVRFYQWSQ